MQLSLKQCTSRLFLFFLFVFLSVASTARAAGQAFSWGNNEYGQLGIGTNSHSNVPFAVEAGGVLDGKTIKAVAAGWNHSLALTTDGQVYSWGQNQNGELGAETAGAYTSNVPLAVRIDGVLAGKTVIAIAAGFGHNLALTSEGKVYSWGMGGNGQLGNGTNEVNSYVPVAVTADGALAGKTVTAIAAGTSHSVALTADGQVFSWGSNYYGQLGENNINGSSSNVPVAVYRSGLLAGKTIIKIASTFSHTLALSSDGQVFGWGNNDSGQLGNGNYTYYVGAPVAVDMTGVLGGKTVTDIATGFYHSLALAQGKIYSWGNAYAGVLGNGSESGSAVPIAVDMSGALAGKTVTKISASYQHNLVLTSTREIYSWGNGDLGQLGTGTNTASNVPIAANMGGELAGKVALQVATGGFHSLTIASSDAPANEAPSISDISDQSITRDSAIDALAFVIGDDTTSADQLTVTGASSNQTLVPDGNIICAGTGAERSVIVTPALGQTGSATITITVSDGTLTVSDTFTLHVVSRLVSTPPTAAGRAYSWGLNDSGQLGSGNTTSSNIPIAVYASGALAGKTITATATNQSHSLVLTSEGRVYAWGSNSYGQLGSSSSSSSSEPVRVYQYGVLQGKTIIAIAAGLQHSLALSSEGKIYAWGSGSTGQLGDGSTSSSSSPVEVDMTGALAGKTVIAIAAGYVHNLALTDEGQVYSWGNGNYGQLGNGTGGYDFATSLVPVKVGGALIGKIVTQIAAGYFQSSVLTGDGKIYSWGSNYGSALGNGSTTNANVPVATVMDGVLAGKTVTAVAIGGLHGLALDSDGKVYSWGDNAFGQHGDGGTTSSSVPVAVNMSGELSGKTVTAIAAGVYHSLALTADGTVYSWGSNQTGELGNGGTSIQNPFPVAVDTSGVLSGKAVSAISSSYFHNIVIVPADIPVNTPPTITDIENQSVPRDASTSPWLFSVSDNETPVAELTISGTSDNQTVVPNANIVFGGTTNNRSLVITPAAGQTGSATITVTVSDGALSTSDTFVLRVINRLAATPPAGSGQAHSWGSNEHATLGHGDYLFKNVPAKVYAGTGGVLAGKTVVALSGGYSHCLALTSEGKVYSWGFGVGGTLGNGSGDTSRFPVEVVMDGALAGKTVVAVAAGSSHSLALTSDGEIFSWGTGQYGQLGNGSSSYTPRFVPIAVNMSGALAGKKVIAIAAGIHHNLALTDDGQVYSWGSNEYGQLGGTGNSTSNVPIKVTTHGDLAGKVVTQIAAGAFHSLILTDDGKMFAWGYNAMGALGDGTGNNASSPVAVNASGALAGKNVTAIAAGGHHCLVLTSAGEMYAWGYNETGALGNGNNTNSNLPVAVERTGALASKTVTSIAGGFTHSLALTSEGEIYTWGANQYGELGTGNHNYSNIPVAVAMNGRTATAIGGGRNYSLAIATGGPADLAPTISEIADQTIFRDHAADVAFTVADGDTSTDLLTLTATSSNQALVKDDSVSFTGGGPNRVAHIIPEAGQVGQATITITVSDGDLSSSETFVLTVTAPNEPPTITDIVNQTVERNKPTAALSFTVGDSDTPAGDLTVTGSASNKTLVPDANIVFGGSGANRTVTITPAPGQAGETTITVTVSDGELSSTDTFVLTVTLPADQTPPTVTVTSPANGGFIR